MKTKYIVAAVLGAMLTLSSCVKDLEALPLNETDVTSETAYNDTVESYLTGLAKLYNTMSSHSVSYVTVNDEGASQITRAFFVCQEATTDACKVAWQNDSWTHNMNTNTWSDADNDAVFGVFFRSIQAISFCNEFLRQTTDAKLNDRGVPSSVKAKVQEFRAEARVIRAWYYWMAMDVFGAVPFTTEKDKVGNEPPKQADSKTVYEYIVKELEEVAADDSALPAARTNYPRVDKGTALGLLARIYLNAETYKGEAEWLKAKQTCERIYGLGYTLCDNYAHLFRGDNGENPEAINEFLFAIPFDTQYQQSWGGTTVLTAGAIAKSDVEAEGRLNGNNAGWAGLRVDGDYVEKYFNVKNPNFETGDYECDDNRGKMFYIKGRLGEGKPQNKSELYNFQYGWSYFKFNDTPHNQTKEEFGGVDSFSNIDLPVIRLGEIHLIYAEACVRLGQDVALAQSKMDELAVRTGVEALVLPQSWSNEARDMFVAERARELMWESCRRTDLIRYNLFCTADFPWPFKGNIDGNRQSQGFEEHLKLFAVPQKQLDANPHLHNPEGYDKNTEENTETPEGAAPEEGENTEAN